MLCPQSLTGRFIEGIRHNDVKVLITPWTASFHQSRQNDKNFSFHSIVMVLLVRKIVQTITPSPSPNQAQIGSGHKIDHSSPQGKIKCRLVYVRISLDGHPSASKNSSAISLSEAVCWLLSNHLRFFRKEVDPRIVLYCMKSRRPKREPHIYVS